jgi:hypothetical protein
VQRRAPDEGDAVAEPDAYEEPHDAGRIAWASRCGAPPERLGQEGHCAASRWRVTSAECNGVRVDKACPMRASEGSPAHELILAATDQFSIFGNALVSFGKRASAASAFLARKHQAIGLLNRVRQIACGRHLEPDQHRAVTAVVRGHEE